MSYIYSLLMYLLTPYLLIRLWWKGRRLPAYRTRISDRFCFGRREMKRFDVWIHAVSLGEVIAATPLIESLLNKNRSVFITTMTPTGLEQVQTRFGNKVSFQYAPYDLPTVVKRFFTQQKFKLGLIMETELWPNLIYQAQVAKVPLLLANARLSDQSFKSYLRFKFLFQSVLNQFSAILAQSKEDAKRFISLGANVELVQVLGNIKFDLQTLVPDAAKWVALKNHWGNDRVVVIAASTHDKEESQILLHLKKLQKAIPNVILLIAPRHPERFRKVYQLSVEAGFHTGLRTELNTISIEKEVIIVDSLGELLGVFQISDFAFIGGSLIAAGGHNVLEPIAMNVPVFSGKYVFNFKSICRDLEAAKAISLVHHAEELMDSIIQLHADKDLRSRRIKNASAVLKENKGSLRKHLEAIETILDLKQRILETCSIQ